DGIRDFHVTGVQTCALPIWTSYWFKAPSSHFASGYEVLADIVRNSVIDPGELDKERLVILEEIRSVQDAPDELVHDVIDEVVWEIGRASCRERGWIEGGRGW